MIDFLAILAIGIGLVIGSFLNCLIWRMHQEESLAGRSYCPKCRQMIAWYDNLPVLSFFLLRGRCRHCRQKISWQYPLVELTTALFFYLSFREVLAEPQLALWLAHHWLVVVTLIIIFVYDWRWQLIPVVALWPLTAAIFIIDLLLGFNWWSVILFGALGTGFFLLQYILTRKRGLGEGDIWLGLFLGLAFLKGTELLLVLFLAYTSGALVSSILLLSRRKKWRSRVALGPFLAFGAIITLIWGQRIIAWYLHLF